MNLLRILSSIPFLFSFFPCAFSQITDNFSDGDFTQNPAWLGDTAHFIVNTAGELQLNAPEAGSSILAVQGNISENMEWNLHFRMEFAPSASNLLRIYLFADQQNLPVANGYFLEIGENINPDALRLFRQDGTVKTLLATGVAGLVASDPTDIQLRVTHTSTGTWECEAASGNDPLQPQFTLPQTFFDGGTNRYFGFQCVYTATRKDKFFFDDISILAVPDTTPPVLLTAIADDATQVTVVFDEKLDSLQAVNVNNYDISNGVGQPAAVSLLADRRSVLLTLAAPLASGNYTLQVSGLKDLTGNTILSQTADFQFLKIEAAGEFDILINEIMADPDPSRGLPDAEWLELYNRSGKTIDLASLRIQDATGAPVTLPAFVLLPGGYIVVTALAKADTLQDAVNGIVLGAPIGATALNNDGDILTLSDLNGNVIDRVAYSIDWHTVLDKAGGGWSLERINPTLPCLGGENWQSCPTLPGGTPSERNASFQNAPDTVSPRLLAAFPESATSVLLSFSEGLDNIGAEISAEYHLSPPRNIASAVQLPNRAYVRLVLTEPLQAATIYTLTIGSAVTDCSGNPIASTDTTLLGLPEEPDPQDIVVNEIMFNPAPNNGRYIEFYNRSNKIFNWSEFFIANFSDSADIEKIELNRLFLPGQYDVFTEFPNNIRNSFDNIRPENILENDLPPIADDEGNITLYWSKSGETVVVDSFDYTEEWHNALFSDSEREGVALERIDPDAFTNSASNWTSASPVVTGAPGTPTLPNSQRLSAPPAGSDLIYLPAERLSPDDDGYEDFLPIHYSLPQTGFGATMTIFDSEGIPVKRLVRQELIGTEGSLRWDGDLDDGTRANPGIYVLFLELYGPDGTTERVKKAVAVVGRF